MARAEQLATTGATRLALIFGLGLGLALVLGGCPEKPKKTEQQPGEVTSVDPPRPEPEKPRAPDPAVADIPYDEQAPDDPARRPTRPADVPSRLAARYILVKFAGAQQAPLARRSKDEAGRRAERLALAARKKDVDFVELASRFSGVAEDERGLTAHFSRGQMTPAFEAAAASMEVGQVSDAFETEFGYYVIMRVEPEEYSTAHILIQYKGAQAAPVAITRSKEDARKLAERVHARAIEEGTSFAVLAERNSDSPSRIRGGVIRPIVPGQMPPEYDNYIAAVEKLKVGEISPVVETPFGFHVIKRLELQYISARHILISWDGSEGTPREPRSKRDAELLARKLLREIQGGRDFAEVATAHSDDTDSAQKGGDLGRFARGTLLPRFEQIAFGLKVGQLSDPLATRLGFHIIQRTH